MTRHVRFGAGQVLDLDPQPGTLIADFSGFKGVPLTDSATAVCDALAAPVDYPALAKATVPGDHVVLAVDRGVPHLGAVVRGVLRALSTSDVSAQDITVLLANEESGGDSPDLLGALRSEVPEEVRLEWHDPGDHSELAYLAASKDNRPIYVNRKVFDADLVLPISCLRPGKAPGYWGVHGGLFPAFSDQETQARFRSPESAASPAHRRRRREEVDEAAWLLGVQIVLRLVPGAGDSILQVLAGEAGAVAKGGRQACESAWLYHVPRRAGLVVAAIEGGPQEQTWENFGRALSVALAAVEDEGAIVLCTDLQRAPGPALRRLAEAEDDPAALRHIRRERSPDAVSASLLLEARQRAQVFLLSGLDEETVEDLGVGYVTAVDEIDRLCEQYESCVLLGDAHRAAVALS